MSKNLSIAYSVKNKKKMAKGGPVNESAKYEQRPMPEERDQDSKMVGRNSGNKPSKNDSWTDNVTVRQAQKPSITKLSQPKIVGSDAFSVRNRDQRDENNDQIDSFYPESDKAQPKQRYNEDGPNRQGPKVPDMERQHKARRAAYEQESENQYSQDMAEDDMKKVQSPIGRYAKGGKVGDSSSPTDTKTSTTGNKTKTGGSNPGGASTGGAGTVTITTRDLGSKGINVSNVGGKTDSKNHGGMDPGDEDDDGQTMMADGGEIEENPMKRNRYGAMESRPDKGYGAIIVRKANGGPIMEPMDHGDESEERDDEAHMMDELSSTEHGEQPAHWRDELDADMQNGNRLDMENQHSNGRKPYYQGGKIYPNEMMDQPYDEADEEHHASIAAAIMAKKDRMYADGGMVDIESNEEEQPNGYDSRNAAVLKEHYGNDLNDISQPSDSNEHSDELDSDDHDMISHLRSKMNMRRQFKVK